MMDRGLAERELAAAEVGLEGAERKVEKCENDLADAKEAVDEARARVQAARDDLDNSVEAWDFGESTDALAETAEVKGRAG